MKTLQCSQCSSTQLSQIGPREYRCHHCGSKTLMPIPQQEARQNDALVGSDGRPIVIPRRRPDSPAVALGFILFCLALIAIAVFLFKSPTRRSSPSSGDSGLPVGGSTSGGSATGVSSGGSGVQEFGSQAIETAKEPKGTVGELVPLRDTIGNTYFVGIVKNTGEIALENPKVELTLLDAAGKKVAVEAGYCPLNRLYPGQEAPVQVLVQSTPKFARASAELEARKESYPIAQLNFTFSDAKLAPGKYNGYTLSGQITNASDTPATHVQVVALLLDAGGKIIAMDTRFLGDKELTPGETSPFTVDINLVKGAPKSFRLYYSYLIKT